MWVVFDNIYDKASKGDVLGIPHIPDQEIDRVTNISVNDFRTGASPALCIKNWVGIKLGDMRKITKQPLAVLYKKMPEPAVAHQALAKDALSLLPLGWQEFAEGELILEEGDVIGSKDINPADIDSPSDLLFSRHLSSGFLVSSYAGRTLSSIRATLNRQDVVLYRNFNKAPKRRVDGMRGIKIELKNIPAISPLGDPNPNFHWAEITDPEEILMAGDVMGDPTYVPPPNVENDRSYHKWVVSQPGAAGERLAEYLPQRLWRKVYGKLLLTGNKFHSTPLPLP